jgi:hypothetical protein
VTDTAPGPDYCHSISAECLDRLRRWDGLDGKGPDLDQPVINVARFLAVVPTSSGGLQIEWHCNGWDVEIEVDDNGEFKGVYAERANN